MRDRPVRFFDLRGGYEAEARAVAVGSGQRSRKEAEETAKALLLELEEPLVRARQASFGRHNVIHALDDRDVTGQAVAKHGEPNRVGRNRLRILRGEVVVGFDEPFEVRHRDCL